MRLTILFLPVFLQGCLYSAHLEPLGQEIGQHMGQSRLDKEAAFTLGPVSLGLVRALLKLAPDAETRKARQLLSTIRHIEVATYKIHGDTALKPMQMPKQIRELLQSGKWELAVRAEEDGPERVWILYREQQGEIKEFLVASVDTDQLTLLNLKGSLNRLVAWATHNS